MNHRLSVVLQSCQGTAQRLFRRLQLTLLLLVAVVGLTACGDAGDRRTPGKPNSLIPIPETLQEVAPPAVLQALSQELDVRPQVQIVAPRPDAVLQDNRVAVRFQVDGFSTFKDDTLGMGPHLHVIVDNGPYQAVYDPSEPLILEDLEPGTHTVRAFASRPWHESFKTAEAYAQVQFHVFTRTPGPDLEAPLLTYSRPKGEYGAEPIMLDVYLHNAPLHMLAQEDSEDAIADWKVRCTINGQSFTFDAWEPIYLTGFNAGKNWLQIELLDENDNPIPNAYNNTARLITYNPGGSDTLSKLVRGELSLQEAKPIIIEGYTPPEPPVEEADAQPTPGDAGASITGGAAGDAVTGGLKAVSTPIAPVPIAPIGNTPADEPPLDGPAIEAAPEPAALPETEALPSNPLVEETLPELTSSGAPPNQSPEQSSEQLLKAPEPVALPRGEALPPGLLVEETLPEITPAAGPNETPAEEASAPQPLPKTKAFPSGILVEEMIPEIAPAAAPDAE